MYHESMNDWSEREDFPLVAPPRPTIRRSNVPVERVRGPVTTVHSVAGGLFIVQCSCGIVAYRATREAANECSRLHLGWHDNYDE